MAETGDEDFSDVALINAADAFPDLERLRDDFDIVYFLDLCAGLEAAILHDRLSVTAFGPGAGALLEPLAEAGVLYDGRLRSSDPMATVNEVMERPRARELMEGINGIQHIAADDMALAPTVITAATGLPTDLALEDLTQLDLVLPFRQTPIYLSLPSVVRQRNAIYQARELLAQRHGELRQGMLAARRQAANRDLDLLPLPPLATETLARAATFDELGEVLLEQRRRYAPLRRRFAELRRIWASPRHSFGERHRAKAAIERDMARLSDRLAYAPSLLEPVGDMVKVAEAAIPAALSPDPTKVSKLMAPLVSLLDEGLFRLRMRPLFGLLDYADRTTLEEIAGATRVLFRHELTDADATRAKRYADMAAKFVPPPLPAA